jgi:hypothetical protein
MANFKHTKLKDGRFLLSEEFTTETPKDTKQAPAPTHHLFIIDCSGSMWNELAEIRKDLYNKISTLLRPSDSVSIIWFSGRGSYGVLVEDFKINSDTSLKNLKKLIDTQLTSRGLTAFCEPLQEAQALIKSDKARNSDKLYSLFFLTDGYDNGWSEAQILESVRDIASELASATIVEYGYYCNKDLLNKMATEVGGAHIFAEDFQDYEPYMERQFTQQMMSARKVVTLSEKAIDGFAYSYDEDGNVISYKVSEDNEVFIDPDSVSTISYMTSSTPRTSSEIDGVDYKLAANSPEAYTAILKPMYAGMNAYSKTSNFNTISDILRVVGDAYFIVRKANTFGTQKINELEAELMATMQDPTKMFREGYNPDLEPAEDAYCVMDMIDDLMASEDNKWYPSQMKYKRMSRKTERKGVEISKEDKENVESLLSENKIDEAMTKLQEVKDNTPEQVEFINEDKDNGFPITSLTWNNKRANLSVQAMYKGYINLPTNDHILEKRFDTNIFRNYSIIKDGVIHTYSLPVSLDSETFDKLQDNGLLEGEIYNPNSIYQLDFSSLPVINQKMVREASAEDLFRNHYSLIKLKARNSVFNYYKKRYLDGASKSFSDTYGDEATAWLKEIGISSYGFNPKVALTPTTEETMVNTMEVKIDKLSSLPPAKSVVEKFEASKPLTAREEMLEPYIKEFTEFYKMVESIGDEKRTNMIQEWIDNKSDSIRKEKRELENSVSRTKFLTIVGKSWFTDLESRENKELVLEVDNQERKFIVEDKMSVIKI